MARGGKLAEEGGEIVLRADSSPKLLTPLLRYPRQPK